MGKFGLHLMSAVLAVIFFVLVSLGFAIGWLFESFHLNYLSERIEKEAKLAAYTISSEISEEADAQRLALDISEQLNARVTIISADGTVIGESAMEPAQMENHSDRPELIEAGQGGPEIAIAKHLVKSCFFIVLVFH